MAARATRALRSGRLLLLSDVVVAECVFVLQRFYSVDRRGVARMMRSMLAFPAISAINPPLILRALELYEQQGLHFAEAYLVASAELTGVGAVVSFDRAIDRIPSVERVEP